MLTGRRAFGGTSAVEVISDVLKTEPDWAALPAGAPTVVRSLLRRCLQRDPGRRLRDAADARFQIEEALTDSGDAGAGRTIVFSTPPRRTWWGAAVIIASAAAVAVSLWFSRRPAPDPEEVRLEINAPPTTEPTSIALSPDGKMLVFVATSERQSRLWVRPFECGIGKTVGGNREMRGFPFWSPDSRSVGFAADAQLKRVDVESGGVRGSWHPAARWAAHGTVTGRFSSIGAPGPGCSVFPPKAANRVK